MGLIFAFLFFGAAGLVAFGPAVSSFFTPRSDLAGIKAAYEGPDGRAGADKRVVAIDRAGDEWVGRRPERRVYRVTLEGPNGDREDRRVAIDIQLFGTGNLHERT